MYNKYPCTRSEMDITTVFRTVVGGSNPSGCTKQCPLVKALFSKYLVKNVDNYVGNVHKGHS